MAGAIDNDDMACEDCGKRGPEVKTLHIEEEFSDDPDSYQLALCEECWDKRL